MGVTNNCVEMRYCVLQIITFKGDIGFYKHYYLIRHRVLQLSTDLMPRLEHKAEVTNHGSQVGKYQSTHPAGDGGGGEIDVYFHIVLAHMVLL